MPRGYTNLSPPPLCIIEYVEGNNYFYPVLCDIDFNIYSEFVLISVSNIFLYAAEYSAFCGVFLNFPASISMCGRPWHANDIYCFS